jgi:hypothetical protein
MKSVNIPEGCGAHTMRSSVQNGCRIPPTEVEAKESKACIYFRMIIERVVHLSDNLIAICGPIV